MIYPKNFEEKIGFDKVRDMLKEACLCDLGKQRVEDISFYTSFELITKLISQAEEFRQICLMEGNFPVGHFIDVTPVLKKIRIIGTFFEISELADLRKSLESIHAILNFFKNRTSKIILR